MSSVTTWIGSVLFILGVVIEIANCYFNFRYIKDKKTSTVALVPILFYLAGFFLIGNSRIQVLSEFVINLKMSVLILVFFHILNIVIFPLVMRRVERIKRK